MRNTTEAVPKVPLGPTPDPAGLRDLVRPFEPVASLYLAGGRPGAELRLRALVVRLNRAGAPPSTVDALVAVLVEHLDEQAELVAFAAGDRTIAAYALAGRPAFDTATYGAPAHVLPVLSWIAAHPAYVEVVVDRRGADITAVRAGEVHGPTTTVVGPDDEIECNAPGGWSQPRYQRRAVDSWQHNAAAVADATARAVFRTRAELLLVAGDIRAIHLMLARLPERPLQVRRVSGGRAADGSAAARAADVARARAAHAQRSLDALMGAFRDADRAAAIEGAGATLAALAAARLRTVFVDDAAAGGRPAWFGPEQLCAALPTLDPDGSAPRRGTLVDVAVRAALLTDARVCPVDAGSLPLADGVGGLCRYG